MRAQVISRDGYNNKLIIDSYDGNLYIDEENPNPPNGAVIKAVIDFFLHKKFSESMSLEVFLR